MHADITSVALTSLCESEGGENRHEWGRGGIEAPCPALHFQSTELICVKLI